jgi:hypothetical protein
MKEKVFEATLTPFSEGEALAMVVVPVDDEKSPSKVFVVELALPIRQSGKELNKDKPYDEGVIIYSVDATVPTGVRPLVFYPKSKNTALRACSSQASNLRRIGIPVFIIIIVKI